MEKSRKTNGGRNNRKRTDTYIINANTLHICNNGDVLYSAVGVFEFQAVKSLVVGNILSQTLIMMEDGKFTSFSNVFFYCTTWKVAEVVTQDC